MERRWDKYSNKYATFKPLSFPKWNALFMSLLKAFVITRKTKGDRGDPERIFRENH
jgi:hypothetical protein